MNPKTLCARLLLATSALALAACGTKEGRIDSGLKKGADFVQAADWDKANVEVRNVLQIDPKNARAYLIAAQVSEGQKELPRAYAQYGKALELQPELLDAKLGQARLLLLTGDTARAQTLVKEALAVDARHPMARTLQAALLVRADKQNEALALAKDIAAAGGPLLADTSLLLAGLHANAREWAQAAAVIDQALKQEPRHLGLLQAAVELVASNPQDTQLANMAADFFKRAVAQSPKNTELWLSWARYHLSRKESDAAEKVLRDAVQAQPEDGKRRLALADLLQNTRGVAAAEKQLQDSIKDRPRDMSLRFGLVNLYRGANRVDDAQKVLQEIIALKEDTPSTINARTQLAGDRLASGKTEEAGALLAEVLQANPRDNAALLLRGRMHLTAGAPRDAVQDFRGVLRDQPTSPQVLQLLARAYRAAGEPQLARDALTEAARAAPTDARLRALLVADMADAKDFKGARAELDAAIQALPDAPALYELKAQMAMSQKDTALAWSSLEQLKARQPKQALAYVRLGQLHTGLKKYDLALKEYDAGMAAAPGDAAPYVAAVTLLTSVGRHEEAMARIQARSKAEPGNVLHQQLTGEVGLARRDWAGAQGAFRAVIAALPSEPTAYLRLARSLAQQGDATAALATLTDGERAAPQDRSLPLARAELLARLNRHDDAIALYETLNTRFPDDDVITNNLAYLLAEVKRDPKSTERALQLAARFAKSSNPGHLDSLGWIHYQLGQYDKAVPLLEKAVALAPTPLLQLHLGQALVKGGDAPRGKVLIRKAIDSKAELPRLDEARDLLARG